MNSYGGDGFNTALLAEFLSALAQRRAGELGLRASSFLSCLSASDPYGAQQLEESIKELVKELAPWIRGESTSANGKADSPVDMIDPCAPGGVHYELDSSTGLELSDVLEDLQNLDRHRKRGAEPPTRLLFDGPPGCGKTQAAVWIAGGLGRNLAVIMLSKLISKWIGETGARFLAAVEEAREKKAVLLIDELDAVGSHRSESKQSGEHATQVVGAMNQILEDPKNRDLVIIGATNLPDMIDPAVARRLQTRIKFGFPDEATRRRIARYHWRLAPFDPAVLEDLLLRTDGKSGDALVRACHAANRKATRRGAEAPIEVGDVIAALAGLTREVPLNREPSRLVMPGSVIKP
jgi:hypothetical protein